MSFNSAFAAFPSFALVCGLIFLSLVGQNDISAVEDMDGIDGRSKAPSITAVAIDEKNSWAIAGSQAGLVMFSWPELVRLKKLPTALSHIHDIALSPDGKTLAVAGGSPAEAGEVELFNWPSGELWKRLRPHDDLVYAVAWRDDSEQFALASADKTVTIFAATTEQCIAVLDGHSRPVLAVEFLADELGIVSAGVDESLRLWEISKAVSGAVPAKRTLTNHMRPVVDLAVRPNKPERPDQKSPPIIVSVGEDSTVRLWQPTVGRMMRFAKLDSIPRAVCWMNDGKSLVVACSDGKVRTVNSITVEVTLARDALVGCAYCLDVDSTGALLVGGVAGQLKRLPSPF